MHGTRAKCGLGNDMVDSANFVLAAVSTVICSRVKNFLDIRLHARINVRKTGKQIPGESALICNYGTGEKESPRLVCD